MLVANETPDEIFRRWLPGYQARAATVAGSLGELFQAAMDLGEFDKTESVLHIAKPREFLKEQREKLPYRVLYFIYSSQFDQAIGKTRNCLITGHSFTCGVAISIDDLPTTRQQIAISPQDSNNRSRCRRGVVGVPAEVEGGLERLGQVAFTVQ